MNPYAPQGMMFDPYAGMMPEMGGYDWEADQAQRLAAMQAEMQRQQQEQQEQQSGYNSFGQNVGEYMANAGAAQAPSGVGMGMAGGGGALQAATAAPLAQAAPLASQAALGGGSVVGPMSAAPVAGMSMAPAGVGAAGAGAGAAGAGAGGGAAGAGAGAGMLAAAPWLAIPAAVIGSMQWTNNTNDDVDWGTWFTDPGTAHGALGGNIEDVSARWFGEDVGGPVGSMLSSPSKVLFPSSPGEWVEGIGDLTGINPAVEALGDLGRGIGDFLGGLF